MTYVMSELISGCCINFFESFTDQVIFGVGFGFSLCPFGVKWWPHNLSLDGEGFH